MVSTTLRDPGRLPPPPPFAHPPTPPDIVWLLFLMKDMKNLDLASRMLAAVEKGFRKAHGEGLQRLTALKGEHCAEKLLYVRLHLLQVGIVLLEYSTSVISIGTAVNNST